MASLFDRLALSGTRHAIDRIDDRMLLLFADRQRLAGLAGRIKTHAGLRRQDATRERAVMARAHRIARRCGLDARSVDPLMSLLIAHAHLRQRESRPHDDTATSTAMPTPDASLATEAVLRALPPPRYWRPVTTRIPAAFQQAMVPRLLSQAIASPERTVAPRVKGIAPGKPRGASSSDAV